MLSQPTVRHIGQMPYFRPDQRAQNRVRISAAFYAIIPMPCTYKAIAILAHLNQRCVTAENRVSRLMLENRLKARLQVVGGYNCEITGVWSAVIAILVVSAPWFLNLVSRGASQEVEHQPGHINSL